MPFELIVCIDLNFKTVLKIIKKPKKSYLQKIIREQIYLSR